MELSFEKQSHWGCRHPGRGAKKVGGKRGENAGAQDREEKAGVVAQTKGADRATCRTESGPYRLARTWTERPPF